MLNPFPSMLNIQLRLSNYNYKLRNQSKSPLPSCLILWSHSWNWDVHGIVWFPEPFQKGTNFAFDLHPPGFTLRGSESEACQQFRKVRISGEYINVKLCGEWPIGQFIIATRHVEQPEQTCAKHLSSCHMLFFNPWWCPCFVNQQKPTPLIHLNCACCTG